MIVVMLLLLIPMAGAAQQSTDIKKPTRSRVTEKDKNTKNKASNNNTANTKDTKNNQTTDKNDNKKPVAKVADTQAVKPNPATPKADDKKTADAAAKPDAAKPANDTAAKPVTPAKPKRVPVDPNKVQFDGIDVSKHQGNINWEELRKNSKIQFVYIKATEGSNYVDPRYRQNINNARKHGFKVGSYHYFTDLSSARTQFQNFIRTVNREEQDLLPVIDVEKRDRWSPQQLRDSVQVFAELIEDYFGVKPLIYTFETFFNRNLGKSFEKYPIFIAKYPKGQEQPNINGIKWILWQFSESGKFNGVKENYVDMSRFNKGCSINDILYNPGKHKPKNASVREAVDHKEKPATINMTEQKGGAAAPKPTKRQQEEAKKQAEKEKKAKERSKKLAEEDAKKKAEADKKAQQKAKEKAEQQRREKARQEAREAEAKKEAEAKAKAKKEAEARAKAKAEAEAKAKRKAEAQKARQQKANQATSAKTKKTASLMNSSAARLSQSQRNDSIRSAKQSGRKTNKSSADND